MSMVGKKISGSYHKLPYTGTIEGEETSRFAGIAYRVKLDKPVFYMGTYRNVIMISADSDFKLI